MTEAGLLAVRHVGTKRLYKVRKGAFGELRTFLEVFWDERLSALKRTVDAEKIPHGRR
jgi:hypothetical protein